MRSLRVLRVTNIQRGCVNDGPGVRTTVFLKGCPLCCPWCCNPETQSYEKDYFVDDSKCLKLNGIPSKLCRLCERNGGSVPLLDCPFGVVDETSCDYNTEELMSQLIKDETLFLESTGGVTFSGGEPLFQAESLLPILKKLKQKKVNVALETTLFSSKEKLTSVLDYVDCFIVDLKFQPQMYLYNNDYFNILKNNYLALIDKEVVNRMVFVNEMASVREDILSKLKILDISTIEVLMCHNLGEKKYYKLGLVNKNYEANSLLAKEFVASLVINGINAKLEKI